MTSPPAVRQVPLRVRLEAEPPLDGLDLATAGAHADGTYECEVTDTDLGQGRRVLAWRLRRRDGAPFAVRAFRVETAVPALDLHRLFVPVLHEGIGKTDRISLPWHLQERCLPSWSFPLIAALNRADENRFCLALMDHVHAAEVSHSCYDEDARIAVCRVFDPGPRRTALYEEALYVSRAPAHVFDEVRAFARAYDAHHGIRVPGAPPAAWAPVWCSWYGVKEAVDAGYIRAMLPLLQDWGIGTVIVDAGWFRRDGFDPRTGHYVPDEAKFPDLRGLVEEVQARGLRLLLWCAPLFRLGDIGHEPFIAAHRFRPEGGGPAESPVLCPRSRAVRDYACRTVDHLLRTWGADGLKIDFIDPLQGQASQACVADHEHDLPDYGEAVHALLQGIRDAARAVRPDALLEFRMNYSTLATRAFATSHRAQDAPFDVDHIRRMCTRLKSWILDPGAGPEGNAAVHTDPAYWLNDESPENVARFMASLVTSAVPMLSMQLTALPAEHRRIARAWLRFYADHRDLLLFGDHRVLSADAHHSLFVVHRGAEALFGAFTSPLPGTLRMPAAGIRRAWILNGSAQTQLFARLEGVEGGRLALVVCDRELARIAAARVAVAAGRAVLDLEVPIGGALRVEVDGT